MRAVLALERAAVPCLYLDRGPAHVHGSCSGRVESAARMERRSRMGWDATVHEPVPSAGQLPPAHGTSGAAIKRKTTTNGTRTAWQCCSAQRSSTQRRTGAASGTAASPPGLGDEFGSAGWPRGRPGTGTAPGWRRRPAGSRPRHSSVNGGGSPPPPSRQHGSRYHSTWLRLASRSSAWPRHVSTYGSAPLSTVDPPVDPTTGMCGPPGRTPPGLRLATMDHARDPPPLTS